MLDPIILFFITGLVVYLFHRGALKRDQRMFLGIEKIRAFEVVVSFLHGGVDIVDVYLHFDRAFGCAKSGLDPENRAASFEYSRPRGIPPPFRDGDRVKCPCTRSIIDTRSSGAISACGRSKGHPPHG